MQHAANATLSEAFVQPEDEAGYSAFMRLRQGASARSTWVVEETPGGTMVSVGADDACDWQLRAAFVPGRAFSVLVVGGRTFIRSGREPGVLVNGRALDDGWVQLDHGARIDLGLARIEVTMGYGDWYGAESSKVQPHLLQTLPYESPAEEPVELSRPARQPSAVQAKGARSTVRELGTQVPVQTRPIQRSMPNMKQTMRGGARRNNSTIELTLDDLDYMGTRVFEAPDKPRDGVVSGEYAVEDPYARYSAAPSLLGRETSKDKSKLWRYAVAGVVTVGAYGGWVFLLDYL